MKIPFITDSINKRLAYILEQFLDFSVLDIEFALREFSSSADPDNKSIYYLSDFHKLPPAQGIFIHNCGDWQKDSLHRISYDFRGRGFFVWEGFCKGWPLIEDGVIKTYVNFDLFGQAFYQLSCCREYTLEAAGRNLSSNARDITDIAAFEGPNVNALFLLLEGLIADKFKIERAKAKRYPSGKQFCVVLTHDIDTVKKSVKDRAKHGWHGINRVLQLCRNKKFARVAQELFGTFAKITSSRKYDNISYLKALEEKNNIRSSFNVYVRTKKNKSGFLKRFCNPDYNISKDAALAEKIRRLPDGDFEIGIHGSYSSGRSSRLLSEEVKGLEAVTGRKVFGGRQHFLDYSVLNTPQAFGAAGIEYDTSLGFRDINGFRSGACLPYYLYHLAADNATDVLEIPLVIMDGVLFDRGDGIKEDAWQSAKAVLEKVKSAEGCCSVVWHQRVFDNQDYPCWEEVYLMLISWVKDNGGVLLKPGELNKFWRDKKKNRLAILE